MDIEWQKFTIPVLAILIIIAIIYLVRKLEGKKDKIIAILSIFGPLLVLIFQNYLSSPSISPDYIDKNRSWLEPTLKISKIDEESFRASYDIKNIGNLPAEGIRIAFSSPEMKHFDKSILNPRSIAPNGSILYKPNPLKFKITKLENISWFTLAIDYHTTVNNEDLSFCSVFKIALNKDELAEDVYKPTSILRLEGEFSDEELEDLLGFRINFKR